MAEKTNQQLPKVLRIGVVQGGKVVHERLIKPGQNVTVGESPKNTFVFSVEGLAKRFTLFQVKGSAYALNFTDEMSGKVQLESGIASLQQLRERGDVGKRGGLYTVPVSHRPVARSSSATSRCSSSSLRLRPSLRASWRGRTSGPSCSRKTPNLLRVPRTLVSHRCGPHGVRVQHGPSGDGEPRRDS